MSQASWRTMRIATYNIHRCRGLDGRTNLARVAEVIRDIDPDVIALQEVIGAGPVSMGQAAELGAQLGMGWVMAPTRHRRGSLFGNVVLSRLPIKHHVHYDLSWNPTRHEQREGRVDRFSQPSLKVRVVTYYGEDNGVDRIIMRVLLRKLKAIRNS